MFEVKDMKLRREKVELRKEALIKELKYLEEESESLSQLIRIYENRSYDPIVEEAQTTAAITTEVIPTGKDTLKTARLKSAIEEIVRTCGPITQEEVGLYVDKSQGRVSKVMGEMVNDGIIEYTRTSPRKYTMK